jgi:hypothetical protein
MNTPEQEIEIILSSLLDLKIRLSIFLKAQATPEQIEADESLTAFEEAAAKLETLKENMQ